MKFNLWKIKFYADDDDDDNNYNNYSFSFDSVKK